MQKYLVEFVGTFFLMLAIGATVLPMIAPIAPFFVGAVLVVLILLGGPISGAHYNPAVTLAFWLRGDCPRRDVVPYIAAQVVAASLAALASGKLCGAMAGMSPSYGQIFTGELAFTWLLVFVILCVAGRGWAAFPIGAVVTIGGLAVGGLCGAAFNPAVTVGLAWVELLSWDALWAYFAAQFVAALIAVQLDSLLRRKVA